MFCVRKEIMDGMILAGGKSLRMEGKHKGFLVYNKETFMERLIREMKREAEHLWISYGTEIHASYEGCPVIMDEYPGCGPIGGIHAGLRQCQADAMMVAACDMPFLRAELYRHLKTKMGPADGVVPLVKERIHPLAAIYSKRILPVLEEQISNENYRLTDALKRLNIIYVDVSGINEYEKMLRNINTVEEYGNL